ncbi:MAG TPA: FN3 associated domain-containing protein, partial [Verrucomicrobiae bacterium]
DANGNIYPVVGCTATPVIDPATGTMYVEAFTKETSGANVNYVHRLHALDITTGLERTNFNSPAVISCTNYPGTGTPGQNDVDGSGHILWNGLRETCRPALLLANGMVYLCYASPGDHPPYYGWIFSYDARTLAQTGAFNDDPNAGYGGIWMTGNGPAADTNGNVYVNTGNGQYDTSNDYGDSVLKLNGTSSLALEDYFTPYNQATLVAQDLDVSSAGLFLLPDSAGSAAHRHLLLSGSKTGSLYLIDRDTMGHYNSSVDADVQSLAGAVGGMWCSPAYFNGMFYVIGSGDHVKSFTMANATMGTTPTATSPNTFSASATPCLSANGTNNGILWAIDTTGAGSSGAAVLYAYNATNVSQELYNSSQNLTRDNPGAGVEFTTPVEANGKVYMGAQYEVSVFGNASFIATPVIAPNGGVFTNSTSVTLSDTTPGVSIYYTLDGTTPTTNSILYTAPFMLIHGTVLQAIAALPGFVNSGLAQASFINSSEIGTGTGLLGAYYGNHTSASPYTGLPTMTETDAVINFNWTAGPGGGIAQTGFTVKWTGGVQPQYNETYTFYGTTDDGMRVWVNGRELINSWVDQASTTYQGSIALKAQQLYNIEVDYYQNGGGAAAELQWSSRSTAEAVIPQTQLYPYTNPPPSVAITSPTNNAIYTASASATVGANADAPYNSVSEVDFYTNNVLYGSLSNSPDAPLYEMTMTGLAAGSYALTAVAVDGSGLMSTSAPVNITVNAGSGQPYGLANKPPTPAFFNMPTTFAGSLPPLLSEAGVFNNTPSMTPTAGLIPYAPNVILWSDGAAKTRYMAVPNNGGTLTPSQQIGFAPTNYWTFPAGTVFVKTFQLNTDTSNPNVLRRLETRLLVRDINGAVYGVTYKWRPDYSDADLLTNSLYENITITNSGGILTTQSWYYPSPSDCLQCHTPVANYVLGVNTRQLNGNQTYPSTGVTDNQLRTLNRLGLFNPAFNETNIATFEKLSALTNTSASFEDRVRSYLDANCAQCHQPRGTGPTFDARYDTSLTNQNLIYGALKPDGHAMIVPRDIWRSEIHQRMDTTNTTIRMPPLARQDIDTNAVAVLEDWINSLSGTPALAPVTITPNGGLFFNSVGVALQSTNGGAAIYYTLDDTTPTTDSLLYSGPFNLTSNAVVSASEFESNYINSLTASALFLVPPAQFFSENISNGMFQMQFLGSPGSNYVLQVSTNLMNWTPMVTNMATTNGIIFIDPQSGSFPARFYRVQLLQP